MSDTVNIRPGVAILSVLRHLNYKPWYALAEFVDNSLQSFLVHEKSLRSAEGVAAKLHVSIEIDVKDGGRIVIRDNAGGIRRDDFARAFRAAEVPADRTGLSEFGMGMKSAACWFARRWSVRTSVIGESKAYRVDFNVDRIVADCIEELEIEEIPVQASSHFTEIVLCDLHNPPIKKKIGKIKEHLTSIFRVFIDEGTMTLELKGETLGYSQPKILNAPHFKFGGESILWRKEIAFDFGDGQRATGFAALREEGSLSLAGFALFRRKRLIQGSAEDSYRPVTIFGQPNSYRFQRLFGEVHLEGFNVSHTKDGFQWEDLEDIFLELLREYLDDDPIPLLAQAEGYRSRQKPQDFRDTAQAAADQTGDAIKKHVPEVLDDEMQAGLDEPIALPEKLPAVILMAGVRIIDVDLQGMPWRIQLELVADPAVGDWLSVADQKPKEVKDGEASRRCVYLRLSLLHPFMERYCLNDTASIEAMLRVAASLGLAETAARISGVKYAGRIRDNVNELLRRAFSNP